MGLPAYDQPEFEAFYKHARQLPPFDIPSNPRGFPFREPPQASCQSALMPVLEYFASQCSHVTEFGCREGYSTAAFAKGLSRGRDYNCQLISVDMSRWPSHEFFERVGLPVPWKLCYRDIVSGDWSIEETDYLHVDDLHTYEQVRQELAIHGHKVRRFLSFHDTYSQGEHSLDVPGSEGILRAILEYTEANGWKLHYSVDFNHGLQVWERS